MSLLEQLLLGGGSAAALSVTHLTQHITALLREDVILQDVWVCGEVSNVSRPASGHLYFSLKDAGACLSCVMWRSDAYRLRFDLQPGMQVLAWGYVDLYAPRGQYQLQVSELRADGGGALHAAFERTRLALLAEGLFEAERKRPLPEFPRTVAVVTSLSGAAVHDVCAGLRAAPHPPRILLVPAQVQGFQAEASICEALQRANAVPEADLIVLARGGGSPEDLACFNSEAVVRAVAGSRIPVVAAIGHESDVSLADLAADLRVPTPTAAAALIRDLRADMLRRAGDAAARAAMLFQAQVTACRYQWEGLARRAPLARPETLLEARRERLEALRARLTRATAGALERHRHRLALAVGKLDGVSPLSTLARGYASVSRLPEAAPVVRTADVTPGDRVRVRLLDGAFEAEIRSVQKDEP